ncbi:MAG TPA: ice-binding family protein [Alphaproteobacteria bacterium]|nr:ice-binding family protein [Alphaproteobacteria bacterium]
MKAVAVGVGVAGGLLAGGMNDASAAAITLGSASDYGVLVGTGQTLSITGGFNLTGDLGLGNSSKFNKSGTNKITGNYYHDSSVSGSSSGTTTITGSTITQSMSTVVGDALSASTTAGALAGTTGLQNQGGSISLSNSSLTIKALTNLSENVLNISALSLTNGTLTFDDNGYTGAKFIINVTGNFTLSQASVIKGINGASAADIIFNIEGTGNTVSLTGNSSSSVIGTILAPSRNVTASGGGTLTGALIAGVNNAGNGYKLATGSGGYNITEYGYKPSTGGGGGRAPEPSTIALFGAGLAGLAVVRRRALRKKQL